MHLQMKTTEFGLAKADPLPMHMLVISPLRSGMSTACCQLGATTDLRSAAPPALTLLGNLHFCVGLLVHAAGHFDVRSRVGRCGPRGARGRMASDLLLHTSTPLTVLAPPMLPNFRHYMWAHYRYTLNCVLGMPLAWQMSFWRCGGSHVPMTAQPALP